jgi:hypothetical protein
MALSYSHVILKIFRMTELKLYVIIFYRALHFVNDKHSFVQIEKEIAKWHCFNVWIAWISVDEAFF